MNKMVEVFTQIKLNVGKYTFNDIVKKIHSTLDVDDIRIINIKYAWGYDLSEEVRTFVIRVGQITIRGYMTYNKGRGWEFSVPIMLQKNDSFEILESQSNLDIIFGCFVTYKHKELVYENKS